MAEVELNDDLEALFTEKMQTALTTGDTINMPDWIDDMAAWIVELAQGIPRHEQMKLITHAHERIEFYVRQKKG
jgi:hypothetical protein